MSSIVIAGDTSGTVTLQAPTAAGSTVLTLPSTSGNLVATGTTGQVTQAMLSTNVAGNGPAFSAYQSSTQTLTVSVYTKIQLQTEEFDTANAFDSTTNYRFNPQVAGYYQVYGSVQGGSSGASVQPAIYKNGSVYKTGTYIASNTAFQTAVLSAVMYLNGSTDYIELYGNQSVTQAITNGASNGTYFCAFLARAA